MGTTIAVSDATYDWLSRVKRETGVRSFDDVLAGLANCGEHMADRLMRQRRSHVESTCRRLGIMTLTAFGSRAWGAPHASSDLDLVAEYDHPVSLFDVMDAEEALTDAFGTKTDLHLWSTLRPRLADRARRDGVRLLG